MHHQDAAVTLRTCDSIRRRLQESQRTIERSQARVAASRPTIARSMDKIVMCEMAHQIVPRNALYEQLVRAR